MDNAQHIAIVGAGLVGCMLATLLARRGHRVSVFEKRQPPSDSAASGRSTHLVISTRGWRALEAIDAGPEVLPATTPLNGRRIHPADGGDELFQPYGQDGQAIFAIHRNTLNRILVRLCGRTPGVAMHFGRQCVGVDLEKGCIELADAQGEQREVVRADYIFAADGASSKVRELAGADGRIASTRTLEPFGYKEFTMHAPHATALAADAMHAWPRGAVSLFAFPNPDRSFTATLLAPFEGPDSFASLRTREDMARVFAARFPDVDPAPFFGELLGNPVNSLVTVRSAPWTLAGRLALVGDAAHAMVPFLGQGMNAGFEDCMVLVELLERHGDDFQAALGHYETLRKPHGDAVTTMSSAAFDELTRQISEPGFHLRKQLERMLHRLYPERFVPPYQLIAFTHVPYADVLHQIGELDAVTDELLRHADARSEQAATVESLIHSVISRLPRGNHADQTH
ncbi:FAD-dependent oxidoreductase [Pseudoduganella chitinolytica]|uniref:NAD(P)/FAD-dependent oxidoreductase n=1 Tax=Pseudoduganella chitinolytica TaxID=34070 RepID=A0ABY8B921_9BURK|nr:NAD(P)/FAD-dependent oxidoreductase [Pseudoduganella chitinolytica]WEF31548.1 NAD(P)/FAD-dependent oxidoreductase [Pseudoduganella chitinolytica]